MSNAEANKALLKQVYARWHETRGACYEEVLPHFAPNARLQSIAGGRAPLTFTRSATSTTDIRGYFEGLLAEWTMVHFTVDEMIAEGDRVVVLAHVAWINKKTGKTAETRKVDVLRIENGKVTEFDEYYDTLAMSAAAL